MKTKKFQPEPACCGLPPYVIYFSIVSLYIQETIFEEACIF